MSDEAVAAAILEMVLRVRVVVTDTGRAPGVHDLELLRDGTRVGCVEVTSTVVGDIAALRNTLQKQGRRIPAPELANTWFLSLGRKPPLKNFRKHRELLIRILREVEASGKTSFSILRLEENPRNQDLRKTFGVWHGDSIANAKGCQSEILLGEAPFGGAFGVSDVVRAVEREASKEDNIRKLQNCPNAEQHFFVVIDSDTDVGTHLAMKLREDAMAELPDPPRLPDGIRETTVWVATWVGNKTYSVWQCTPGQHWRDLGNRRLD